MIDYTPRNEVGGRGVYWIHPVCLSVRPSVRPSACPLTFRARPVASTVQDGFFPYLAQMSNSMRGWVACDDPWPWPISSRSFGLDLERNVYSSGWILFILSTNDHNHSRVACYVFFRIYKIWFFGKFFGLDLEKNLQFSMDYFHI